MLVVVFDELKDALCKFVAEKSPTSFILASGVEISLLAQCQSIFDFA